MSREAVGAGAGGTEPRAVRTQLRQAVVLLRDAIGDRRGRFGLIVAMSVLAAALESAALVVLPKLLGRGGSGWGGLPSGLPGLVALYLLLVGLAALLLYVQSTASSDLTMDFGDRLRLRLHAAAMSAGWGTRALARPADLVHALSAEAGQCAFATQVAINLATRLIYLPALLAAALVLSPGLAAIALALTALAGLPMLPLARRAYRLAAEMARVARRHHAELADEFAGLKVLKVLRAEAARRDAFRTRLAEVRRAHHAQARAMAATKAWQRFAAATAAVAGAYYGLGILRLDGTAMLALALALARLAANLSQALDLWRQLGRVLPVYGQLRAGEARCREAREAAPAAAPPRLRHALGLRRVAFTYPGGTRPVLAGIDLTLPACSLTILTGPSGAGKSTLADLVMGLTPPTAGAILIDGECLDEAALVAWRARIAYVAQEPFLFHDTIRANLRLACSDASDAALLRALDEAAAGFVRHLPEGLDTVVGERGGRLSGGERQRLMLARAFLRRPDLLVLDEATSALDPESEALVIASLRQLSRSTTILAIAHRSALLAAADRVLHLEDGVVTLRERTGSHRA